MTISDVRETGQKRTKIARITLLEQDGTETVINVTDAIHFIFGFAKADREKPSTKNPMEVMVCGNLEICGEIFYQTGEAEPELVRYCIRRDAEKLIERAKKKIEKSGVDPLAEFLKKAPVPGDGRAN